MTLERKRLGASGEQLAAAFLRSKGYEIVALNWRCPMGEIDLIAKKQETLAICEVKTRKSVKYGTPLEAITPRKKAQLRKLGEYYWNFINKERLNIRFDALSIIQDGRKVLIEHIEDAF